MKTNPKFQLSLLEPLSHCCCVLLDSAVALSQTAVRHSPAFYATHGRQVTQGGTPFIGVVSVLREVLTHPVNSPLCFYHHLITSLPERLGTGHACDLLECWNVRFSPKSWDPGKCWRTVLPSSLCAVYPLASALN